MIRINGLINLYGGINMPQSRESKEFDINYYLDNGFTFEELENKVLTIEDSIKMLKKLGVKEDSVFYAFVSKMGFIPQGDFSWEVCSLEEIYENKIYSIWNKEYPNLTDRFLQLTSTEGEGSVFYDIEKDNIYDVSFNDMGNLINGTLKSEWDSFEDYLIKSAEFNMD